MAAPSSDAGAVPRLIVHLGVQKTGTTSLHHFLQQNSDALAERLVIRTPEPDTPMRPLGRAAIAYSLDGERGDEARLAEAVATVVEGLPQDGRSILISHENLAGAMPGNGGETRLYPALPRILGVLDRAFAPLVPIYVIYSRRMEAWKASVWAQAVRTDGYAGSYDDFLSETRDLPGWDELIVRLEAAVPGRLHHVDLADERDLTRPGRQLLALAGIPAEAHAALAPLTAPSMQRLNAGATEFLRRLNALPLNPQARAKVANLVASTQNLFDADHRPDGTL
jgi:hypothetical protein